MGAILERLLAMVAQLLGIAQLLGLRLDQTAIEPSPDYIANGIGLVERQTLAIADAQLRAQDSLVRILALLAAGDRTILDAIAGLQRALPPAPPTPGAIASEVWNTVDPNAVPPGRVYGDEQWEPYLFALTDNVFGLHRSANAPFFVYVLNDQRSGQVSLSQFPTPDWTDIRPTDTRLSWLLRTEPVLTWDDGGTAGTPHGYYGPGPFPVADWWLAMTEAQFEALKAKIPELAPVWPGFANITEGAPVALTSDTTVPGPLDGIIVTITTPPVGLGHYVLGGLDSWWRLGYVTFVTDDGEAEPIQFLQFGQAIYCPKAMTQAASALVRGLGGVGGTVTPWVRT